MEHTQPITTVPSFTIARVEGYDIPHHAVLCSVPSGQSLGIPVRVLIDGPCDQWRVKQKAMPLRGTWGLVAIVYGDTRAAFWLGAYSATEYNAFTQSNPDETSNLDSQYDYESDYSGEYELTDPLGNYFKHFPDGSFIQIGESNIPPVVYQHVVSNGGIEDEEEGESLQQQTIPVQDAAHTPTPPANPFYININQITGSKINILPDGTVIVLGQKSSVIMINPDGTIIAKGQKGSYITIDTSGNIISQVGSGNATIELNESTGSITVVATGNGNIVMTSDTTINLIASEIINMTASEAVNITAPQINLKGNVSSG